MGGGVGQKLMERNGREVRAGVGGRSRMPGPRCCWESRWGASNGGGIDKRG